MATISSVRDLLGLTTSNTVWLTAVLGQRRTEQQWLLGSGFVWCSGERGGEDNVRTGDSYYVTVGTPSQYRSSHSALSSGRAGGWPGVGWWLAGWSDSCVPATGQSQQSARATPPALTTNRRTV